jgi:hypothetical protein
MSQIKETYGDSAIDLRSVQQWSHNFPAARTELDALPRPDRRMDSENPDRIRELLESEFDTSQKTLSTRVNLHHDMAQLNFRRGPWVAQGQLQADSAFL